MGEEEGDGDEEESARLMGPRAVGVVWSPHGRWGRRGGGQTRRRQRGAAKKMQWTQVCKVGL
jgi:hypothetical protein